MTYPPPNSGQQPYQYAPAPYPPPYPTYGQPVRSDAPKVYPVVIFTLIFGIFGIISAALRGNKASKLGYPQKPYWIAWAVTFVCGFGLWIVLISAISSSSSDLEITDVSSSSQFTASYVERSIVEGEAVSELGVELTKASCKVQDVFDDGSGYYRCRISDNSGYTGSYLVRLNKDGSWEADPR